MLVCAALAVGSPAFAAPGSDQPVEAAADTPALREHGQLRSVPRTHSTPTALSPPHGSDTASHMADSTYLEVISPYAGQDVRAGTSTAIQWDSQGDVGSVRINLCWENACETVVATSVVGSSGEYMWAVPKTQVPGDIYHIQLTSLTASNLTTTGPAFTVIDADSDGFGPYLGIGFAVLVVIGLVAVYVAHRRRELRYKRRRSRLELAHTQQQRSLVQEYERRVNLLLPRCSDPYTGGRVSCAGTVWAFVAAPRNKSRAAVLKCESGPLKGREFWWGGSSESGTIELRAAHGPRGDSSLGYCDWDGDVLRWHSPFRVRRRGNGFVWKYETSDDLTHFMKHGRRRGVSFVADTALPDPEALPQASFPRQWALNEDGSELAALKSMRDRFPVAKVEGSVPPMLTLCVALLPFTVDELLVQQALYKEQSAEERKENDERRKNRALRLYGRIALVNRYPDVKVRIIDSEEDADMKVQIVEYDPPNAPCLWQLVGPDMNPDYRVQLVRRRPDFTVCYVRSFPGVNL